MMQGERVIDIIQDAIEAKEAAKEAKKVSSVFLVARGWYQLTGISAHAKVLLLRARSKPPLLLLPPVHPRLAQHGSGSHRPKRPCLRT